MSKRFILIGTYDREKMKEGKSKIVPTSFRKEFFDKINLLNHIRDFSLGSVGTYNFTIQVIEDEED